MAGARKASVERGTAETRIAADLFLDGVGQARVATGIPFFDHLLAALARHSRFDLAVSASGDLEVDAHHTVEDVGIVLGEAFRQALGSGEGIARFASIHLPMDEALVLVALDCGGRPFLHCDVGFPTDRIGTFPTELVEEFLHAFATHARVALHVERIRGRSSHHLAEAVFKGLGVALGRAVALVGQGVPSTKGLL